jgi:hypothetical protein
MTPAAKNADAAATEHAGNYAPTTAKANDVEQQESPDTSRALLLV